MSSQPVAGTLGKLSNGWSQAVRSDRLFCALHAAMCGEVWRFLCTMADLSVRQATLLLLLSPSNVWMQGRTHLSVHCTMCWSTSDGASQQRVWDIMRLPDPVREAARAQVVKYVRELRRNITNLALHFLCCENIVRCRRVQCASLQGNSVLHVYARCRPVPCETCA